MKPTKKELALEAERTRFYTVCCLALKYDKLRRAVDNAPTGDAILNEAYAFGELQTLIGFRHAIALADFAKTLT